MSVQSQIDRLNTIKERIRTNLVAQGVTVPADTMLEAMAEQILSVAGEPGLVWRGEWDTNASYSDGDAVYHKGSSYICIGGENVPSGIEPGTDSDVWSILASIGNTGNPGPSFAVQPTPPTDTSVIWVDTSEGLDNEMQEIVNAVIASLPVYNGEVV